MSFEKNFCASPWFHARIFNDGSYGYCRWAGSPGSDAPNIRDTSPIQWFQQGMRPVRDQMLRGVPLENCRHCQAMEQHGKISGRQKQLLKVGVLVDNFEKTMLSSPWLEEFTLSQQQGQTQQWPQDWQIDLGNHCNSACVFCGPLWSSRLAAEYKKLGLIDRIPPASWCEDPALLERFVAVLEQSPTLVYLHFIGGETLITPAFRKILERLVSAGLAKNITIGLTTNATVWDQGLEDLLCAFHNVNLGISIECLHQLNDYLRYPSRLEECLSIIHRWLGVAKSQQWLVQIRPTPNVFSIWHLDSIYDFAYEQGIAVESCNFLDRPEHMRPSVLPPSMRSIVMRRLEDWIASKKSSKVANTVINTRHPDLVHQQILEDAASYVNYLRHQEDESCRLPELVKHIKLLEHSRGNTVLHCLPEYEEILRSAGY